MKPRPLEGRTVVDLTTALAGPYATLLLAGLGATVIKVENPGTGGDAARGNPPYAAPDGPSLGRPGDTGMSVSMLGRGRGKLSVTLDLKHPRAGEVFADLVRGADIVVENYAAGTADRLGVGYAAARAANPRIVYTSISGFGAQGPGDGGGTGKAMDTIIQALSGVMLTAGEPDDPPVRFGLPIGDLLAPLYAVIGTLAAVVQAERTGEGQHVDVSMLGALTSLLSAEPFDALEALGAPTRTGALVPRLAPFGLFPAADGWIALCAPTDAFARGVCTAIGRPELAADDRFATRDDRVRNADELHELIRGWSSARTRAEAVGELAAAGVPAAAVRDPAEAVRDPGVLARGEVVELEHPDHGPTGLMGPGVPITFSGARTGPDRPVPRLGQHNAEVFGGLLGYTADRLADLEREGVL
ncbi:CaiB/BaiF CoA-transferase family protein [Actinomadura sp. WMMB 499]|uniref:CaiB/BaiF CoA transferase family protein n=1 Tax=Actinomadura sp. WMMB 499 TaxID=1219491 RepID=UPI0012442931|nr:CoA transferase [Actinomadura sp. WMMB 499]QFG21002.1 CoA transferase [Actinomadura sp. WMMB 499]